MRLLLATQLACAIGIAFSIGMSPADAQQVTGNPDAGATSSPAPQTPGVLLPSLGEQHLLGDWGGLRSYLVKNGIDVNLDYTTESAGNVAGGIGEGFDYAHQIGLQVDTDWQKIAGFTGFSTHLAVVNRAGRNLSRDYIGDDVLQAQEIYGAGFDMAVHGVWLYGEQNLWDGRFNAVFGRIFPGMDFAASPFYCDFMTLTICGHPRALTAEQGFIDWPQNTWGTRVRVAPTADTYVMIGAYASEPFPGGGRSGFNMSTNNITGAFTALELAWEPSFGPDRLLGQYKIGAGYDTSTFPTNAFAPTPPTPTKQGRAQFWVTFDQMLFRTGPAPNSGLTLLGAYAHDDPDVSLFEHFVWTGLLYSGFWNARPYDRIGFAYTYYKVSPSLTQKEELEEEFGLPPTYPFGVQTDAMVLEANYNFAIYRGVTLQPEVEYFIRPGGVSSVHDALVIGLKTHVMF
jgi:porin